MKKLKLFLLLFALLAPHKAHALAFSDIRTEVRVRVKDANSTRQRYTDAKINALINEAQRDVINNTWAIRTSTSISLVAGTTYYTLPTDIIQIERVTLDRKNISETTLIKLDGENDNGAWADVHAKPRQYFQDPAQLGRIGVYPFPLVTADLGTLKIIYFSQAPTLSADSDIPFNSESRFATFHDLLIFYPAYRIYLIEGEMDKAAAYRSEYESRLLIMNERIGSKPNYVPGLGGPNNSR